MYRIGVNEFEFVFCYSLSGGCVCMCVCAGVCVLSQFTACSYIYTHSFVCVCISCTGWSFIIDVCVHVLCEHVNVRV